MRYVPRGIAAASGISARPGFRARALLLLLALGLGLGLGLGRGLESYAAAVAQTDLDERLRNPWREETLGARLVVEPSQAEVHYRLHQSEPPERGVGQAHCLEQGVTLRPSPTPGLGQPASRPGLPLRAGVLADGHKEHLFHTYREPVSFYFTAPGYRTKVVKIRPAELATGRYPPSGALRLQPLYPWTPWVARLAGALPRARTGLAWAVAGGLACLALALALRAGEELVLRLGRDPAPRTLLPPFGGCVRWLGRALAGGCLALAGAALLVLGADTLAWWRHSGEDSGVRIPWLEAAPPGRYCQAGGGDEPFLNAGLKPPDPLQAVLSQDGRLCVFHADGASGPPDASYPLSSLYLRDSRQGATTLANLDEQGQPQVGRFAGETLSPDGRYVAFVGAVWDDREESEPPRPWGLMLRDVRAGGPRLVSLNRQGLPTEGYSWGPSLARRGRYVCFVSSADDLVEGDANQAADVFLKDMAGGNVTRISRSSAGQEADGPSMAATISEDGRWVAFVSAASNLADGEARGPQIYLRDLERQTTCRASAGGQGQAAQRDCWAPALSQDGRYLAFCSGADNLAADDPPGVDVFVRDNRSGRIIWSSRSGAVRGAPSLSGDGRYLAFLHEAPGNPGSPSLARVDTEAVVCEWARGRSALVEPPLRVNALQPHRKGSWAALAAWPTAPRESRRAQLSAEGHWILLSCDGDVYQLPNPLAPPSAGVR